MCMSKCALLKKAIICKNVEKNMKGTNGIGNVFAVVVAVAAFVVAAAVANIYSSFVSDFFNHF